MSNDLEKVQNKISEVECDIIIAKKDNDKESIADLRKLLIELQKEENFILQSGFQPQPQQENSSRRRSNAKQDSFKKKLRRRKLDNINQCELCSENVGDLEAVHIVDVQFAESYYEDFSRNRDLPASLNDCPNGLLLCSNCHTKYDKPINRKLGVGRTIQIDGNGKIHLFGSAKEVNYRNLSGKSVPWVKEMDNDRYYPTSALLKYAYRLNRVGKGKRMRELSQDEEDSDDDDKAVVEKGNHKSRNCQ